MLLQRRLYHYSRSLLESSSNRINPPPSSNSDPFDSSLHESVPRISLSPESMRKVSPRSWARTPDPQRQQHFTPDPSHEEWKGIREKVMRPVSERMLRGLPALPPLPNKGAYIDLMIDL